MQRGSGDSLLWEGATPASILVDMMNMACHRKGSLGWAWMQDDQNLALADPPHPLQISTCRSKYVRALCLFASLAPCSYDCAFRTTFRNASSTSSFEGGPVCPRLLTIAIAVDIFDGVHVLNAGAALPPRFPA